MKDGGWFGEAELCSLVAYALSSSWATSPSPPAEKSVGGQGFREKGFRGVWYRGFCSLLEAPKLGLICHPYKSSWRSFGRLLNLPPRRDASLSISTQTTSQSVAATRFTWHQGFRFQRPREEGGRCGSRCNRRRRRFISSRRSYIISSSRLRCRSGSGGSSSGSSSGSQW